VLFRSQEAEKQLARARKLHERASETGNEALEKAYRRIMLYYMEKAVALEKTAPDYVKRLRDECLEKMHFLEHKMELMEKVWHERLYEQFVEGAKEGFNIAVRIIPYLVAMLVAIAIFRAGGAMNNWLVPILKIVTDPLGMP